MGMCTLPFIALERHLKQFFFNRGVFIRTDSEYWFSMDSKRNYGDQFFTGFSDQCGRVNFGCENMCLGQSTEQKSKAEKKFVLFSSRTAIAGAIIGLLFLTLRTF